MIKQQRTVGSVLKVKLENGKFTYAQILKPVLVFFDFIVETELEDLNQLLNAKVLFYASVYDDVITKGRWRKVGKIPIRDEFLTVPLQFIQDAIDPKNFRLYDPNSGEIVKARKSECEGLERAAVWEAYHIEERTLDHYARRKNIWVESMRIKG